MKSKIEFFNMLSTRYSTQSKYICNLCSETVTNPICPECLTIEIEAWLTLYPDLNERLIPRLKNYMNKVEDAVPHDSTQCIKCENNTSYICTFCFTSFVLRELKKMRVNELILKEFLQFFNFDFERGEFSQEAEIMGVI